MAKIDGGGDDSRNSGDKLTTSKIFGNHSSQGAIMKRYGALLLLLVCLGVTSGWTQELELSKTKDRPSITLSPTPLDFGEVLLGESARATVTVVSDGKDEAELERVRLTGDRDFVLLEDSCSGRELDPGQRCQLLIAFTPAKAGQRLAELQIIDDDRVSLGRLDIHGEGIAATPTQPVLVVASPLDFGELTVGLQDEKALLIHNQGSAPLEIGQIGLGVPLAAPFSLSGDFCSGRSVPPGGNCSLRITFAPTAAGDYGQEVDVPSNDPQRNPVLVRLRGVATAPPPEPLPKIRVRDSSPPNYDRHVDFGETTVGARVEQLVTVRNEGEGILTVGALRDQPLALPFSIYRDECSGKGLQPGGECNIRLHFNPLLAGAFAENFLIPSNDPDGLVTVTLVGRATVVPEARLEVVDSQPPIDDLQLPFGMVSIGHLIEQTVTLRNTGNAPLRLGPIAALRQLHPPFAVTADPCSNRTLQPQEVCALRITFAPTAAGSFNDDFDIPAEVGEPVIFAVSGTGTELALPRIEVTDSLPPANDQRLDYADATVGRTVEATVTVTNSGTADLRIGQIPTIEHPFTLVADQCSQAILRVGESCLLLVSFAPTSSALFQGELIIPSNDAEQARSRLLLTGRGLAAGVNQPPSPPLLLSPAAGQRNLGLLVTLRWEQSSDPDGDAVGYRVRWSTDGDFADAQEGLLTANRSARVEVLLLVGFCGLGVLRRRKLWPLLLLAILLAGWSCGGGGGERAEVLSWQLRELTPATTYYWQIVAEDGRGGVAESERRSFTIGSR
jgi:hypothetical protein